MYRRARRRKSGFGPCSEIECQSGRCERVSLHDDLGEIGEVGGAGVLKWIMLLDEENWETG